MTILAKLLFGKRGASRAPFINSRIIFIDSPALFIKMVFANIVFLLFTAATYAQKPAPAVDTKLPTVVTPTDNENKTNLTDKSFLEKASASLMNDVELSRLAVQRTKNAKLKQFAQGIITDSSALQLQLKSIAARYRADLSARPDNEQQQMIEQMQSVQNDEFDRLYVSILKKSLDANVGLYDNAAGQVSLHDDIRALASRQLAKLRDQQKTAHGLMQAAPANADIR